MRRGRRRRWLMRAKLRCTTLRRWVAVRPGLSLARRLTCYQRPWRPTWFPNRQQQGPRRQWQGQQVQQGLIWALMPRVPMQQQKPLARVLVSGRRRRELPQLERRPARLRRRQLWRAGRPGQTPTCCMHMVRLSWAAASATARSPLQRPRHSWARMPGRRLCSRRTSCNSIQMRPRHRVLLHGRLQLPPPQRQRQSPQGLRAHGCRRRRRAWAALRPRHPQLKARAWTVTATNDGASGSALQPSFEMPRTCRSLFEFAPLCTQTYPSDTYACNMHRL
mmetsp:Transcript_19815/g.58861  ORF Transcript_19815/g.58861 Transcript_19815/m.58861 type:complete len:277 (-) Transcript_19815:153-983(-)